MKKLDKQTQQKIIKLRKKGFSYKQISDKFNIGKGTAYKYAKHIKLNKKAKEKIQKTIRKGVNKAANNRINKRLSLLKELKYKANKDVERRLKVDKDMAKILSALLFWCEGNKTQLNMVRFTNSDPKMIKLFLYLLRKGFNLDETKFRCLIHLHEYHNEKEQIKYWSKITNIPQDQFHNSYRKPNTGKRKRKDYPGCLALTYYNDKISKELWAIYKAIQKLPDGAVG